MPSGIATLVTTLALPAFVEGRYFDVLAANPLATALSPRLTPGSNRLRDLFLDPAEKALYEPYWNEATAAQIAGFRQTVGTDTDDPRFIELVGELSLASPRFRQLWARHDVAGRKGAPTAIAHPQVGELHLNREKLAIGGTDGMLLVVYHPDPGSDGAEKLALLASVTLPTMSQSPASADDSVTSHG